MSERGWMITIGGAFCLAGILATLPPLPKRHREPMVSLRYRVVWGRDSVAHLEASDVTGRIVVQMPDTTIAFPLSEIH